MSQGNGHVGGHSCCLQGCVHQGLPQHWFSTQLSSCAWGQAPDPSSHVPVVLHQVLLHEATTAARARLRALPLQDGVLLAYGVSPGEESGKEKESRVEAGSQEEGQGTGPRGGAGGRRGVSVRGLVLSGEKEDPGLGFSPLAAAC